METAKLFVRERRKVDEKSKEPRFSMVAAVGSNLKVYATHLRKKEAIEIAKAANAELVILENDEDGSGLTFDD